MQEKKPELSGKDYFTEKEAAHYMGVGITKWKEIKKQYGLVPLRPAGKNLYRRADLRHLIESSVENNANYYRGG